MIVSSYTVLSLQIVLFFVLLHIMMIVRLYYMLALSNLLSIATLVPPQAL